MEAEEAMLTTVDNPWSPYTHWNEWLAYDTAAGHHTLALLGRIVVSSDELSDEDQDIAITEAINEIVRENVSGLHVKAYPPSESSVKNSKKKREKV